MRPMIDDPLIPAWLISALAFLAAWALWLVRPMPRLVRVSVIVTLLYFGVLYLWVHILPFSSVTRIELARMGLIMIFISIISNSLLVRWKWCQEKQARAQR